MGWRWVNVDGNQVMDAGDEVTNVSESGTEDDEDSDDPEEIKVLKV
jgi:hypothetical protein